MRCLIVSLLLALHTVHPQAATATPQAPVPSRDASRLGWVRGRVVASGGAQIPARVTVTFAACLHWRTPEDGVTGEIAASPDPSDGGFAVAVPEGCRDLLISDGVHAPAAVWNVRVRAGRTRRLRALTLRDGGTVTLGLLRAGSSEPVAGATVEAIPEALLALPEWGPAERLARATPLARSDERGWAVLAGVPAGRYRLRVSASGFPEQLGAPLQIEPGRLSEPPALELSPGGDLVVELPSPLPLREPRISVVARDVEIPLYAGRPVADAPVGGRHKVAFRNLAAGSYELRVSGSGGAFAASSLKGVPVTITAGEKKRVLVLCPTMAIAGRLLLAGEGVAADLSFLSSAANIVVRTGSDGAFATDLPGPGEYLITARSDDAALASAWKRRLVEGAPDLVLELPSGVVAGRVEAREAGILLEGTVTAHFRGRKWLPPASAHIAADGSFSLRSLAAGRWAVTASTSQGSAVEAVEVELAAGGRVEGVVLPLAAAQAIEVRVRGADGEPAPGVAVACEDRGGEPGGVVHPVRATVTDPRGIATCEVSTAPAGAAVVIGGRGLPAVLVTLPAGAHEVSLPPVGGALALRVAVGAGSLEWLKRLLLVELPGGGISMPQLHALAPDTVVSWDDPTAPLRLEGLAPGTYSFAWASPSTGAALAPAATVTVYPGELAEATSSPPPAELLRSLSE